MYRPERIAVAALLGCLASAPRTSRAGAAGEPAGPAALAEKPPPALVGRPVLEWTATAAGGAVWFTTGTLIKKDIAPSECRWCEPNAFDDELRSLRWFHAQRADLTSDVVSFGLAPVAAGGLVWLAAARDGRASELSVDLPILAEALVASGLAGEAFRFSTARERPSVHALAPDEKQDTAHPEENNLSFVSGHAATSFALAFASGTIATLRRRRLAPVVWATGLTLAAVTSYLRIASDEHYATDVLGGIAVGTTVGLAVPLLHRSHAGDRVGVTLAPLPGGGAAIALLWR